MEVLQVILEVTARAVSQCYNLRSRSVLLHTLGLLLNVSGICRFWVDFQLSESLWLLLFSWIICMLLECVAVEIFFQIPWHHLKLENVTSLRYSVFVVMLIVGLLSVYPMWELCMEVHDCVWSHQEHSWIIIAPPLWSAMATAMAHAIVLAICIPVQVIVIPLECNSNIPNINFRSHVTLTVNLWLFVHFMYLSISYSHYNAIALCYRLCCTLWMILYCYPVKIHNTYHWFKQQLPNCIRSMLRPVRDRFVPKVWRNFRAVIERRRREGDMVDNQKSLLNMLSSLWNIVNHLWTVFYRIGNALLMCALNRLQNIINYLWMILYRSVTFWVPCLINSLWNMINSFWTVLYRNAKIWLPYVISSIWNIINRSWIILYRSTNFWVPCVISCIITSFLLRYDTTSWGFTAVLLKVTVLSIHSMVILYQMFHHCFFQALADHVIRLISPYNNFHGAMEAEDEINVVEPKICTT